MNPFYKNLSLWLVVGLVLVALANMFNQPAAQSQKMNFSDFMDGVDSGDIGSVTIQGDVASGKLSDGKFFSVYVIGYPDLVKELRSKGVRVEARPADTTPWYLSVFVSWFPMILLIAVWIFFMRQMQGGGGPRGAMSFGKSKAKMLGEGESKATFKDVAGVEEAKEDLQEIIEFLKYPEKFQKLGGKIPKGVLLMGPPGTGKTLLAKAIAGEAEVPFFTISGSDFVEMFVGVGASRVRDLFEQAKKNAPCIIFVDEIDAVGRHRGAGLGGGHDEREQTLNQLLVEMDGFEDNQAAIVIAATNRPDVLDPALLRPGRFDRQIIVPKPDIGGREAILHVHMSNIPMERDVDARVLARGTPGFTGADLANLCNEAALLAAREDAEKVCMRHFELSKDKVMMGAERRSMIISETEKNSTAVHEAGHALVALLLPKTDPIHKVSIIPRGRALGVTQQLPVDEKHTHPKDYLINRLAITMGGRAAEDTVLSQFTTGASNDIEVATNLARKMVCEWGMNEKLGPIALGQAEEQIFLGREITQHRDFSERTAVDIDREVRAMLLEAYETAKKLLIEHREVLDAMTELLIDVEVVEGRELAELIKEDFNRKGISIPENAAFSFIAEEEEKKKTPKDSGKQTAKEEKKEEPSAEKEEKRSDDPPAVTGGDDHPVVP